MMTLARYAALRESQGFIPIIAMVSPYRKTRKAMMRLFKQSKLIYVDGTDKYIEINSGAGAVRFLPA